MNPQDKLIINEEELRRPIVEPERGDLDNPLKVKRKEILARLEERANVEDFGWILSDPRGRRFVWKLLEKFQVFGNCYNGRQNDTFIMLGERNAGLKLMVLINEHFPERYLEMLKESKKQPLS